MPHFSEKRMVFGVFLQSQRYQHRPELCCLVCASVAIRRKPSNAAEVQPACWRLCLVLLNVFVIGVNIVVKTARYDTCQQPIQMVTTEAEAEYYKDKSST